MNVPEFPDFSQMEEFGISGTRQGSTPEQHLGLKFMIEMLHDSGLHLMHHGKCRGIDAESHNLARRLRPSGMKVIIHPPIKSTWRDDTLSMEQDWVKELPPAEYWERNCDIAAASAVLVICPLSAKDAPGPRSGTWKTAGYA